MSYQKLIAGVPSGVSLALDQARQEVSAETGAILNVAVSDFSQWQYYPELRDALTDYQHHEPSLSQFTGDAVTVPAVDDLLETAQSQARAYADTSAGETRAKYLTVAPGQEITYTEKSREAAEYQTNPSGAFPFLQAEAASTGATVAEVATLVLATRAGWLQVGSAIEGARMGFKSAIEDAQSVADVRAAKAVFDAVMAQL